jgi:hypothetical protein
MNTLVGIALSGVTLIAFAQAGAGGEGLPLRRGVYVEAGMPCQAATSASRLWFGGGYVLQSPHAHCEARRHRRAGPGAYVISLRCYEQGERAAPFDVLDHVGVISRTELSLDNDFGRFRYRWCRG